MPDPIAVEPEPFREGARARTHGGPKCTGSEQRGQWAMKVAGAGAARALCRHCNLTIEALDPLKRGTCTYTRKYQPAYSFSLYAPPQTPQRSWTRFSAIWLGTCGEGTKIFLVGTVGVNNFCSPKKL